MATFQVGQRVRIIECRHKPELVGKETTITELAVMRYNAGFIPWLGYGVAIHPNFKPRASALEPINDINTKISWEEMKGLWTPEHLEKVK